MPIRITPIDAGAFAPLYRRDDPMNPAQRVYVALSEDGGVGFAFNDGTVGFDPEAVWQKRTFHWAVPTTMTAGEANALLERIAPLLERVHAGHRVSHDGRNMVGELDDDAQMAKEAVHGACWYSHGSLNVSDPMDWLFPGGGSTIAAAAEDLGVSAGSTDAEIDALAESCVEDARREGTLLDGDVGDCLRRARDRLRELQAVDEDFPHSLH